MVPTDIIKKFDSYISPALETLSIKIVCFITAEDIHQEYPVEFEFITKTKMNIHKKEASTSIICIQGIIPGTISISGHDQSLYIVPQPVHILCDYNFLCIDTQEMHQILQHEEPIHHYSEWMIDAIKDVNIIVELKTNHNSYIDWPLGIKSAMIL